MPALSALHTACGLPVSVIDTLSRIPIMVGGEDVMRWKLSNHDEFTLTSAWEHVRRRAPKRPLFDEIWNSCLAPTISIFLWSYLLGRIQVDEVVQSHRVSLDSMCLCCRSPHVESMSHLFILSESVVSVWSHFASWFPPSCTHMHMSTDCARSLGRWRHAFPDVARTHISLLLPCLITWFTWTERNSRKHRGVPFLSSHIIWQVIHQFRTLVAAGQLTPRHWLGCNPQVDFMPPIVPVRRILWKPPEAPWVKLDTDGSFDTVT